jgi:hypothetical protein
MKLAFIRTSMKLVKAKPTKDFTDLLPVLRRVVRVNQNVVKVDNDTDIDHVRENVIHEALKTGGSISKSFRYNKPFE